MNTHTRSLKTKFIIAIMIALIFVLGTGMFILFLSFRNAQLSLLNEKIKGISHFVGRSSTDPILYKDILKIDAIIEDTVKDGDIVYALIYDEKGNLLNTANTGIDPEDPDVKNIIGLDSKEITEDILKKLTQSSNLLHFSFPIDLDSTKIGTLKVGVTKKNINNYILKTLVVIFSFTFLTIIVQSYIIYYLFKKLVLNPFEIINKEINKISKGDLTVEINLKSDDEIGMLAYNINKLVCGLKIIVNDVKEVAKNSFRMLESVVYSSRSVERGAHEQQSSITEAKHLVENIDKSANDIFSNIDKLVDSSETASSAVIELNQSMNQIVENVGKFNNSAKESASSVEGLIKSISAISTSINKLTNSVEETATSITEINMSLKEVQNYAEESASIAEKVAREAENKGLKASVQAIKGMEHIKESVLTLTQIIERLGKRSENIGKIINVIDEITEQTGMLALNAAILSAQSGESGKGFSIVADNIKDLAKKTAKSTKEIVEIIDSVKEDTIASVKMVKIGLEKVEEGVKLVNMVNEALMKIKESIELSAERAGIIKKATDEQANAIRQITDVINTIKIQIETISKAMKEQTIGSKQIIETVELIKHLSEQLKSATKEQKIGNKQIEVLIVNVSEKAAEIAKSTSVQKENTKNMVSIFDAVNNVSKDTSMLAEKMANSINSLENSMKALIEELEKFKV